MNRPDIAGLLADLEAIERCCEEGDWDSAAEQLAVHDRQLRAMTPAAEDADALRQLHARQLALQQRMAELRDATASELQQFAAKRRGAARYAG